ncbi:hypothetical protein ACQY0O_002031 [Thecaphora frezii]
MATSHDAATPVGVSPAQMAARIAGAKMPAQASNVPRYASSVGCPYPTGTTAMNIGGHPVQSDGLLLEKQQQFDRMKLQERVVHAAGSSAFGRFEVTSDVTQLTSAKMFQPGKVTPAYTRFSTVTYGREYPDSARNPRGFATKFYTEDGNYDIVGLNWPVFFVRDPWLGPDNIRSQMRNPSSFLLDYESWFDFLANVPESNHAGLMLMSDHGTPRGWRFMNGFGCHTFSWVNAQGQRTYIKYHWLPEKTDYLTMDEATKLCGEDPDYAKRDLWEHLEKGGKATWTLAVQTMTPDEAKAAPFDPFDVTKVWPRHEYKMREVGKLVLDRNPESYHRDVEQAAFSPGSLVPGIEASPDSLLLWRMFFYRDAQYHRLGSNLHQIPVNCPFMAQRYRTDNFDGLMRTDDNNAGLKPYMPHSFGGGDVATGDGIVVDANAYAAVPEGREIAFMGHTLTRRAHHKHRGDPSEYDQVRQLWRVEMSDAERANTIANIAKLLGTVKTKVVQKRYLAQITAVSADLGEGVFRGLGEAPCDWNEVVEMAKVAHRVNVDPQYSVGVTGAAFMGLGKPFGA